MDRNRPSDQWQILHKFSTDQLLLTDGHTGNTIDWQALFTFSNGFLFTKDNSWMPCVPMFSRWLDVGSILFGPRLNFKRETCKKGKLETQSSYLNSYLVLYMYHCNTCQETLTAVELRTVTTKFGAVLGTVKRNYKMPLVISRVVKIYSRHYLNI